MDTFYGHADANLLARTARANEPSGANLLASALRQIGSTISEDPLGFALSVAPVTGEILSARDAVSQFRQGEYGDAALSALGALPFLGTVAKGAKAAKISSVFDLDYFGKPVKILQNPPQERLKGFLSRTKYKAARRITDPDTGDVFIWDANDPALHAMVAEKLGLDPKKVIGDVIGID